MVLTLLRVPHSLFCTEMFPFRTQASILLLLLPVHTIRMGLEPTTTCSTDRRLSLRLPNLMCSYRPVKQYPFPHTWLYMPPDDRSGMSFWAYRLECTLLRAVLMVLIEYSMWESNPRITSLKERRLTTCPIEPIHRERIELPTSCM